MKKILIIVTVLTAFNVSAANEKIESFSKAKKLLEKSVYFDNRETLYCTASFDVKKNIMLPLGYKSEKYVTTENQ